MSLPKEDGGPTALRALGMMTMFKAISLSTATLIYSKYKATAEPRVSSLGDLGYVYLSAVVLGNAPAALWAVSQQHRHLLGLPRPDQALYKVVDDWRDSDAPTTGYAILDNKGDAGHFNRTARAYYNLLEYLPSMLAYALCAGYVFPKFTFYTSVAAFVSRLGYSLGYGESPFFRLPGFILSIISLNMLEGLTLLAGLKALGYCASK